MAACKYPSFPRNNNAGIENLVILFLGRAMQVSSGWNSQTFLSKLVTADCLT